MTTPQRDLALSPAILLLRMLQSVELGHDSLMAEQRTNCVRRLRALLKPIEHLLLIDVDYRRLLRGVVVSDNLDETTVTRRARIGYDDTLKRLLCRTHAVQSNFNCHTSHLLIRLLNYYV